MRAVFLLFSLPMFGQLSTANLERAQADLARITALVENGTLAKSSLKQAEERVADAQDDVTLSETLYGATKLEDMTQNQVDDMVAAASRRVDRAAARVDERHKLMDLGIISQSEMQSVKNELYSRQLVLDMTRNRVNLRNQLLQMAEEENRLQAQAASARNLMIRYDGSVPFRLADLPSIEKAFKARFNQDLPVSAIGQTRVHQQMGLDHRNKVDVALQPDEPEGLWLRRYLERAHLSYLAFSSAMAGAATGAHIHIGGGSSRLTAR